VKHERDSLDLLAAALLLIDSINSDPKVRRVRLRTEEVCKEFLETWLADSSVNENGYDGQGTDKSIKSSSAKQVIEKLFKQQAPIWVTISPHTPSEA